MNRYKQTFSEYTSEHLLQKRALGDELADEAHEAIEEIFAERGEHLPGRPSSPVQVQSGTSSSRFRVYVELAAALAFFALANVAGKMLAKSWLSIPALVLVAGYFVFRWIRRNSLTEEARAREDFDDRARSEGLDELMTSAAAGDVRRVKELVEFGANVNAISAAGSTALMYAARNGHLDVAKYLIAAGANVNITTSKGSTALSIARRFGYSELSEILEAGRAGPA